MRLDNFINEEINVEQYLPHIKKKCSMAIKVMKSAQRGMWRGVASPRFDMLIRRKVRKDRKPKDSWHDYSAFLDNELKEKFGWKPRSEGLFVTGNIRQSGEYGDVYLVFPVGNFKYVWNQSRKDNLQLVGSRKSPHPKDNAGIVEPRIEREVEKWFTDKNIEQGLRLGHEIMIKTDEYFGIHIDWIENSNNTEIIKREFGPGFDVDKWGY